jgi:tRNA(His) 5'-end guanylyltransferase
MMIATAKNTMRVAQHGMLFIFAASSSMNLLFSERMTAFERNGFIFYKVLNLKFCKMYKIIC